MLPGMTSAALADDLALEPFWRAKRLDEMTAEEWEALCDGCGKCCLAKLEDVRTGEIAYTNVACRLLDTNTCRCRDYPDRQRHVKDCNRLTAATVVRLHWLPSTCAYKLVAAGRDLPLWHHLVCGDREAVHRAGMSVRGRAVSESRAGPLEHHIVNWPD